MKKLRNCFLCVLVCIFLLPFSLPVFAEVDEQQLQKDLAVSIAQREISALYGEDVLTKVTVSDPIEVAVFTQYPQSEFAAYTSKDLDALSSGKEDSQIRLFFVYLEDERIAYFTINQQNPSSGWKEHIKFCTEIAGLAEDEQALLSERSDADIGYFYSADVGAPIWVYEKGTRNGMMVLRENDASAIIKTRDYILYNYEQAELAEQAGMTVNEYRSSQGALGERLDQPLFDGKTYPVWSFWLKAAGIPAVAVVLIAAVVIFIIRRRRKNTA